ncbi:PREDICTED: protein CURVATURE THYLAKOID 1D, chloroplastic [Fragaria vesca subsp. vesca]|uniref:protein CURVATURE THYLAKOID 1D, chloroplastic n=1 Tax=Fragaria vesca subsp. vesca TaxID=101020 RepID=UPI0002C344DF|nr:PREDICTED: protein CURVATURE THYLAKOID 1D, chloroplastic [Fragaria vesca subsp. vesca]
MMELCTTTFQPLPNLLIPNPKTHLRSKPSLLFAHSLRLRSRLLSIRATSSEESGAKAYSGEEPDGVVSTYDVPQPEKKPYGQAVVEEAPPEDLIVNGSEGQSQISELLENFNLKLDNDDSYVFLLYGGGALVTLWLASAIIGAIDSIPLFPKLLEVVGLGYTIWFSSRYLIFKKNREELVAKVQVLKQQVLGSNDD